MYPSPERERCRHKAPQSCSHKQMLLRCTSKLLSSGCRKCTGRLFQSLGSKGTIANTRASDVVVFPAVGHRLTLISTITTLPVSHSILTFCALQIPICICVCNFVQGLSCKVQKIAALGPIQSVILMFGLSPKI